MNRIALILGMVLVGILSLSVHVTMLEVLHIPYPEGYKKAAPWLLFINYYLAVLATIWIYRLSQKSLTVFSFPLRCFILFVLLAMLNEDLIRLSLMNGIVTSAWLWSFLQSIPALASYLMLSILVVSLGSRSQSIGSQLLVAFLISLLLHFVWMPSITAGLSKVLTLVQHPTANAIQAPYGWNILIPAYLSYAEPVVACFAFAKLCWNSLHKSILPRICQFVVLILLVKNGLILAPLIYAFYSGLPFVTSLLSMGQFSLEALVLALLTAITWHLIYRNKLLAEEATRTFHQTSSGCP